jgi:mRNA-degrading endonuclease toxin of MazEF toxin-antitoxin module
MIKRRQLLELLTAVSGAATASIVLGACSENRVDKSSFTGSALTSEQLETLRHICLQTIPATTTPGAAEVNCHQFIDRQLTAVFSEVDQQQSALLLDKIRSAGKRHGGDVFERLSPDKQLSLLENIEALSGPFRDDDLKAFKLLKGLIVFGYYTSMPGATQELTYLAMPDGFKGSVPLSKVGSAYSSKAYY